MQATDALGWLPETPSQTAGPYVHIGLLPRQAGFTLYEADLGATLVTPATQGSRIIIEGRILDGAGAPLRDAVVELWQADSHGRYPHPADHRPGPRDAAFRGWGRTCTDFDTGRFAFDTIKPGRVPGRAGQPRMAPHVSLWIVARGINLGLATRLYFDDEAEANAEDPVLRQIEQPARRATLIAARQQRGEHPCYTLDIHLQGERETVFFDI